MHHDEVDKVVHHMCLAMPYKLGLQGQDLVNVFWEEWTGFKNKIGLFSNKRIWTSHPRKIGQSHI
jgi:hypothetical protein